MTRKWLRYLLLIILAAVAFAQTQSDAGVEKVFHLTNTSTPQGIQEIVNMVRVVVDIPDVKADNTALTLTVRGTSDQISLVGWLLPQVDRPAGPQPPTSPAPPDYRLGGSINAVVRVFYLENTPTSQAFQEAVNGVMSIFEVQRVTFVNGPKAIVVRGTAEQIAAALWLIGGSDQAPGTPHPSTASYTLTDPRKPVVRLFYLSATPSPQAGQETVNAVRSLGDLQHVVALNRPGAIVVRGTAAQIAMAQWLIGALDKPAPVASSAQAMATQYSVDSDVARVFYLPPASPAAIQDLINQVRATTHMQRVVACNAPRAVALRGTAGQVALAEKLLQDAKM